MKLPNAEHAIVERKKIADYLPDSAHPYGASKARFFASFGFVARGENYAWGAWRPCQPWMAM